ncbi:tetratricopeptide repeat protein [Frankia gtarii]|uniref:tetratricopeptide repeat protein n=1 Tax=Frankia gtarii TaxID=2950102 RepID=UPI0021C03293|nr:tetratricopeptide repeat protein [Frankia gtarii]
MPDQDPLANALGEGPATALRQEFARRNQTIAIESGAPDLNGYTTAKHAVVSIEHDQADSPAPQRCIVKVCPPTNSRVESAQHAAALQYTYENSFVKSHLVEIAFAPVQCPDGETAVGQRIAGGNLSLMRTLSKVRSAQLHTVCLAVQAGLLKDWTGTKFQTQKQTVPELLRCELRPDFTGWIVPSDEDWITTDDDPAMPNPWALLQDTELAANEPKTRLTGHSHGDLHFENVLVQCRSDGVAFPDKYWLIDLSGFEPYAPLTRDPATLLISVLAHQIETLDSVASEALLDYLVAPEQKPPAAPSDLVAVVDALIDPGDAPFAADWREMWDDQLRVSLLAEAMRHATYSSVGTAGRWWCLRLAGQLARKLVPGRKPSYPPRRLTIDLVEPNHAARLMAPRTGQELRIINRSEEKAALHAAMTNTNLGVIVVHGEPGVGKSALVEDVVAELRAAGVKVVEHDAAGIRRPDAMMLVEAIEAGVAGDRLRAGESPHSRLAVAVDALDTWLAIVIERAEVLLDHQSHTLVDDEFDEALELLAVHPDHPVKVVLVTRQPPGSARANTWPRLAEEVRVQGLRQPHFKRFLDRLDPVGSSLSGLNDVQIETLRDCLKGNPSHASLAHSIVHWIGGGYEAATLVEAAARRQPEEIPQFLADALWEQLSDPARLVLAALAAFGTPVEADAVAAVVEDRLDTSNAGKVAGMLQKLARLRVIEVSDGRYGLPPGNTYWEERRSSLDAYDWQKMLHVAARQLGFRLKASTDIHGVDDLRPHLALIDVLVRARRYEAAHEILHLTDQLLRRWDGELVLLDLRERIRDRLDDPHLKMSNLNALGDLYVSRGYFPEATKTFKEALDIATRLDDPANRLRILINMAGMHWEAAETEAAIDLYSLALTEIDMRPGTDAEDRMDASEGLANCYRRWGDYQEAMAWAAQALGLARTVDSSRTVTIAIKIARWHAETGNLDVADEHIALAEAVADEQIDSSLDTACVDARADLMLDQGRPDKALALAGEVVAAARRQRNPVILLQAYTIRCMAYLQLGEIGKANEAIEKANSYRRLGRSLIVPALHGLAAAMGGNTNETDRRFAGLRSEAAGELGCDPRDIGARQFLSYAFCWTGLADNSALHTAAEHMRAARAQGRPPARGIEKFLTYMVLQLENCGVQRGRLRPVLDAITGASREPGPA